MIRNTMKVAVVSTIAALALSACGGGGVDAASTTPADSGNKPCGSYAIAMHAWVGYTASAAVLTEVGKSLGCTITQTQLDEGSVTYDAMEAGTIDVIVRSEEHTSELQSH
mgnify:CR=1 FL=1